MLLTDLVTEEVFTWTIYIYLIEFRNRMSMRRSKLKSALSNILSFKSMPQDRANQPKAEFLLRHGRVRLAWIGRFGWGFALFLAGCDLGKPGPVILPPFNGLPFISSLPQLLRGNSGSFKS
jgi:hypothetical protein